MALETRGGYTQRQCVWAKRGRWWVKAEVSMFMPDGRAKCALHPTGSPQTSGVFPLDKLAPRDKTLDGADRPDRLQ